MKKNLVRNLIIFVIWSALIIGLLLTYFNYKVEKNKQINNSNSIVNIDLDKETFNVGDEVTVTVKTKENATAISFYLNYDKNNMSYKSTERGVYSQDYPEQNLVRVIYYDLENKGRDTFNFKFNANKSSSEDLEISLTNTVISTASDNDYSQNNDEIKISIQSDQKSINTKNIIMISLASVFVVVTIVFTISLIKSKKQCTEGKIDDKKSSI